MATSTGYVAAQENLKSGDVSGLWLDESEWTVQSRSERSSSEESVIGGYWWPCQTAAATEAVARAAKSCCGIDLVVTALRMATLIVDSSGQGGWRPEHRGRILQGNDMIGHDRKHPVWIGGSILSSLSTFQQMWISKHREV